MYNIGKKLNNTIYMEENIIIENVCYLKILVNFKSTFKLRTIS